MNKTWMKIGMMIIAVILALSLLKDVLIKASICSIGSAVIGAPLKIGQFNWNILTQKIRIKDLQLYNPPGFPNQPSIEIPQIAVDYDLMSLIKGRLHFAYIEVNLKEIVIVRNKDGQLNVDALKLVQQKLASGESPKKEQGSKREDLALTIDEMRLNIDRTVYIDFSHGGKPTTSVFNINLKDKVFRNITSVNQLTTVILVQGMAPAAIKGAAIYGVAKLKGLVATSRGIVSGLFGQLEEGLK